MTSHAFPFRLFFDPCKPPHLLLMLRCLTPLPSRQCERSKLVFDTTGSSYLASILIEDYQVAITGTYTTIGYECVNEHKTLSPSALLAYELLLTSAREVNAVWSSRPSYFTVLYLLNRYPMILSWIALVVLFFPMENGVSQRPLVRIARSMS